MKKGKPKAVMTGLVEVMDIEPAVLGRNGGEGMKPLVEWSDELSVGIEEIDEQHKVLVDLINQMHQAIHQRRSSDVIVSILEQLSDYTRIHFAVEESLMRILNYPEYEAHKAQHEKLIAHMSELQQKVVAGRAAIGFELMHFLKVWLTKHILENDQAYTDHFIMAGANPQLKKRSWVSRLWGHN